MIGGALLYYWSTNYFGLKKLPGYVAPPTVPVDQLNLAALPLIINYRVVNFDKYVSDIVSPAPGAPMGPIR